MILQPINAPAIPDDFHFKLRNRFVDAFLKSLKEQQISQQQILRSACIFKGIESIHKNYEDTDYIAQQQSTFWYLFGVKEPDCYASITVYDILFVPKHQKRLKMWMTIKTPQELREQYKVDQVRYIPEMNNYFQEKAISTVYLYSGIDSDSGLKVDEPAQNLFTTTSLKQTNRHLLWPLISNLRVIKTQEQLQILRYVCKLTSEAHRKCIKATKSGLTQIQLHALFHFQHTSKSGSIHLAFPSICSSGQDCATLHYIQNQKVIQAGQLCLHDMGGKFYGYCADQAITFPADKVFTQKQKHIYNAVYQAQKKVLSVLKAGVSWLDMHLLAERVILEHLIKIGIIKINGDLNSELDTLQQLRVGAIFFPHGLGHFYGLKVHDNGGYSAGPQRIMKPGIKSLRTLRTMEENMTITVEPGCYFIDFLIEQGLNDPNIKDYLCQEKINEYREVGGVRLEDDVIIKSHGVEQLTSLPRSIQDLEKLMNSI